MGSAWAQGVEATATPQDPQVVKAAREVDRAQDKAQKLKDAWDRARLEATLYSQRSQRAYKRWLAAKGDWRKKMADHKDRAQLEFELAVERRKLAYDLWRQAQSRADSLQKELEALEQDDDIQAVRDHIRRIEEKLGPSAAPTPGG